MARGPGFSSVFFCSLESMWITRGLLCLSTIQSSLRGLLCLSTFHLITLFGRLLPGDLDRNIFFLVAWVGIPLVIWIPWCLHQWPGQTSLLMSWIRDLDLLATDVCFLWPGFLWSHPRFLYRHDLDHSAWRKPSRSSFLVVARLFIASAELVYSPVL